ncbi:hypothetical protein Tco_0575500 [Tanacetum coccineum]
MLASFKKLKSHPGNLHRFWEVVITRPFKIAFRIFFNEEHQTFREKMYHNLNQLQRLLEIENLHTHDSKTCFEVLRKRLTKFFTRKRVLKYGKLQMKEKEVQAIKEIEKWLKENEMQKQESLVSEGTTLEASLVIKGVALEDCLVTNDADLEASLVTNGAYLEASLVNDGAALEEMSTHI